MSDLNYNVDDEISKYIDAYQIQKSGIGPRNLKSAPRRFNPITGEYDVLSRMQNGGYLKIGSEPEPLSLTLNWVAVPLLWVTSKYAPLNFNVGFVPNLKLPFTNSLSLELVEPTETVSLLLSTNNVPESTFKSAKVLPTLTQALLYTCNVELELSI